MINQKIALSALSIVTALALTGGATFAFFNSQATSSANTFASGTLVLSFDDTTNVQSTTNQIGGSNLAPNTCTGNQTINLYNNGTINGTSMAVAAGNTNGAMSPFLRINSFTIGGNNVSESDANGNGYFDLQDIEMTPATGTGIVANSTADAVMDVCLDQSAGNTLQNTTNNLTLVFTLNQ